MTKRITPFFLRTPDKSRDQAPLYIRIQDKNRGIDVKLCTDIKVIVAEWLIACSDDVMFFNHQRRYRDLHQKLWQIECLVVDALSLAVFNKDGLLSEILRISGSPKYTKQLLMKAQEEAAIQELERIKSDYRIAEKEEADIARSNIWGFLARFCDEIEKGTRRNGAERYSSGSVKSWKSFKNLYTRFDPMHQYTWQQIDREFANKFISFLEDHYNLTSQNKHIGNIKALINFSFADDVHNNDRAIKYFSKKKEKGGKKSTDIWLSESELDALFAMKIENERDEQVRDVFLVGCYTCQRVSDYKAIPRDAFQYTSQNTLVINLIQQKTGAKVCIPVIGTNLKSILERYNYELPNVTDQFLNKRIKIILKALSESVPTLGRKVPVLLKRGKGGKLPDTTNVETDSSGNIIKPRYECVTSHTARRTGITRLYNTGLFTDFEMMSISGHRDVKVFRDYIKLSAEEMADRISEIAKKQPLL